MGPGVGRWVLEVKEGRKVLWAGLVWKVMGFGV